MPYTCSVPARSSADSSWEIAESTPISAMLVRSARRVGCESAETAYATEPPDLVGSADEHELANTTPHSTSTTENNVRVSVKEYQANE